MKKVTLVLLSAVLILVNAPASYSTRSTIGDPGKAWEIPNDALRGQQIFTILDSTFGEPSSYLIRSNFQAGVDTVDPSCGNASDPKCVGTDYRFQAVLPHCLDASDTNCIEDFGTVDASGNKTSATFAQYFPLKAQNQFTGDPAKNIPSGVSGSVYHLPGASFDGGDSYYVGVQLNGNGNAGPANIYDFSVNVFPVGERTINPNYTDTMDAGIGKILSPGAGHTVGTYVYEGPGLIKGTSCAVISLVQSKCLERYSFPSGVRYFLSIRLKKLPSGWLHGRMSDPSINIQPSTTGSTVSITANPLAVPVVYKMYEWANMPADLQSNYDLTTGGYKPDHPVYVPGSGCGRSACDPDPSKRNVIISPPPYSDSAANQLLLWLPYIQDKAQAMYGFWGIRTLSQQENAGANRCFTSGTGITGIVTTNSSTYSAGPPAFNSNSGTLDYKVAAPHFASNGDVFEGSYDLVMRSDVARCVYGFSNAPVNATVSVISSSGSPAIATTSVSETGGWMHLAAKGFTFSSPSIQVKLTQAAQTPVVKPTSTPTPEVVATGSKEKQSAKQITILCTKGKNIKKVTAIKPVCPKGYVKK